MADPITRLREIVEAATPGEWRPDERGFINAHAEGAKPVAVQPWMPKNAALIVASTRLARAVADPAFVEKVAEIVHDFAADYRQDMPVDAVDCARSLLSLLASAAMGDD